MIKMIKKNCSCDHLPMLFLVLLLFVACATGQKNTNDICKEKDKPGFQLNLTGAMIFPDHIFMMDNQLQVYKVPKSSYDGSYGKMVMNIKGIPIEEYWPPFKGNKLWECVKKHYMTIYHLLNKYTGEMFITIFVHNNSCLDENGNSYSLTYSLKTQKISYFRPLKTSSKWQFYVDTGLKIYDIHRFDEKETDKPYPMINTWKYFYKADNKTIDYIDRIFEMHFFYLVDINNPSNRNVSVYYVEYFSDPIDDPPPGYLRENITDWQLDKDYTPVGYLFNGSFYLYALDKLFIFEDNMPSFEEQLGFNESMNGKLVSSSKLTTIKLSDYFLCDSDNQSTVTVPPDVPTNHTKTASSTTASGTMLIIILASVVLLLILIGTAILIYCFAGGNKGKPKNNKPKKVAHKGEKALKSNVAGSKINSKVGGDNSKMTSKQSSIGNGQSKAASSTAASAVSSSKAKIGKNK